MRAPSRCERAMPVAAAALVILGVALGGPPESSAEPVPTQRLTIKYREGKFELVSSSRPVTMTLPPLDVARDDGRPRAGFWYEHRSARGDLRYRRVMENPVLLVFEEAGGSGSPGVVKHEAVPTERSFTILIPAAADGDVVSLFSSPIQRGAAGLPAERVAQFTLRRAINR